MLNFKTLLYKQHNIMKFEYVFDFWHSYACMSSQIFQNPNLRSTYFHSKWNLMESRMGHESGWRFRFFHTRAFHIHFLQYELFWISIRFPVSLHHAKNKIYQKAFASCLSLVGDEFERDKPAFHYLCLPLLSWIQKYIISFLDTNNFIDNIISYTILGNTNKSKREVFILSMYIPSCPKQWGQIYTTIKIKIWLG